MDTITILRELWRRRLALGIAAVVALLVGAVVAFNISPLPPQLESRSYTVAIANSRIFVDTPASQVVEVSPKGSDTLGARATLLSNLMTEGVVRAAIARAAGLRPHQIVATSDTAVGEPRPDPSAADTRKAYVVRTRVVTNTAGEQLPIIEIEAQAPDAPRAVALASATVSGLSNYLERRAIAEKVAPTKRLRVSGLGAPQAHEVTRGPGLLMALAAAVLSFLAGCGLILASSALVRGWRQADAAERHEDRAARSESLVIDHLREHRRAVREVPEVESAELRSRVS